MAKGCICCVGIISGRIFCYFLFQVACAGGFPLVCSSLIRKGKADLQDRSPITGLVALHIAALAGMSV